MSAEPKIRWYARGGGIARCGPFRSQVEATNAMRLIKTEPRTRIVPDFHGGRADVRLVHEPGQRQEFPPDVFVWPEEIR
jgi:hypothetical protein